MIEKIYQKLNIHNHEFNISCRNLVDVLISAKYLTELFL